MPATIERNVEYYVLGHLSKYVQTGAYRINSNSFGSGSIEDVAFKNPDGSIPNLPSTLPGDPQAISQCVANLAGTTPYTVPALQTLPTQESGTPSRPSGIC